MTFNDQGQTGVGFQPFGLLAQGGFGVFVQSVAVISKVNVGANSGVKGPLFFVDLAQICTIGGDVNITGGCAGGGFGQFVSCGNVVFTAGTGSNSDQKRDGQKNFFYHRVYLNVDDE